MPTVFSPPSVSAVKTSVARYVLGSRAASVDGGAALTLAFVFVLATVLVFVLILVFMFAFASGPREHPLMRKQ
jgi:hypothetical protein